MRCSFGLNKTNFFYFECNAWMRFLTKLKAGSTLLLGALATKENYFNFLIRRDGCYRRSFEYKVKFQGSFPSITSSTNQNAP